MEEVTRPRRSGGTIKTGKVRGKGFAALQSPCNAHLYISGCHMQMDEDGRVKSWWVP